MTQALIKAAYESTLKTWADAQTPAIPVAWENVNFAPPAGRYVRFDLIPAQTNDVSIDGLGRDWKGVAQVMLCMNIGAGVGSALTLGAALDAIITPTLTYSSLLIYRITPVTINVGRPVDGRYEMPCWWIYRAIAT